MLSVDEFVELLVPVSLLAPVPDVGDPVLLDELLIRLLLVAAPEAGEPVLWLFFDDEPVLLLFIDVEPVTPVFIDDEPP